jgi:hypothetical protein
MAVESVCTAREFRVSDPAKGVSPEREENPDEKPLNSCEISMPSNSSAALVSFLCAGVSGRFAVIGGFSCVEGDIEP